MLNPTLSNAVASGFLWTGVLGNFSRLDFYIELIGLVDIGIDAFMHRQADAPIARKNFTCLPQCGMDCLDYPFFNFDRILFHLGTYSP
jgi:hypothetical protein